MTELVKLAKAYLQAKRAQELDHTDYHLNWLRSEAHDALMAGLDAAGVAYRDREHAAQIALDIAAGQFYDKTQLPLSLASERQITIEKETGAGLTVGRKVVSWRGDERQIGTIAYITQGDRVAVDWGKGDVVTYPVDLFKVDAKGDLILTTEG